MKKLLFVCSCLLLLLSACSESTPNVPNTPNTGNDSIPHTTPSATFITDPDFLYVWDANAIPEITIHISEDEWNKLLLRFDEHPDNADYFHADFSYKKGGDTYHISDGGLRLRGNTSRRRPEGNTGELHNSKSPDWHHCHFGIHFRKFHKDDEHTLKGIRKINLKWFKDDACYAREMYCYDLFRRYGIWTALHNIYCRVWLQVGNETPAYYGVYEMMESIDDEFIKRRLDGMFESKKGHLWKCAYGADFQSTDANRFSWDKNDGSNFPYEFKGDSADFAVAKTQLEDFILKLKGKGEESFYKWIQEVCDVELLLKTYAVNVAVGMWDDHWNNSNNFYLYFNSTDKLKYQFFFIPYDYDNTLGTSLNCGIQSDAGRQDPYKWGNTGLLMTRLMKFDDFRAIYKNALLELIDPSKKLFHIDASMERIEIWQSKIRQYISNDTGEDMVIEDLPASWGNHPEYRLMERGTNNFFQVKTETIQRMN